MTSTPSLSMLPRPDISGRALSLGLRFVEHYPSPRRPLAPPPAGSGLRPVPGRPGLPYIGYAPMVYDMIPWTRKMFAEFGPVSWSRMFGSDAVYVLGPEAQEVVWLNRDKAFSNELGFDHFTGPFFRRGLLMLDFDEHLHHRRIMQQAFTRPRLLGYLDMLAPAIAEDLAGWQPSDRFRFYTNAKQMLLHLATRVFVGTEIGADSARVERAFEHSLSATQAYIRADVPGGHWARGLRARQVLVDYFRSRIPAKRASTDDDLFSVLCSVTSDGGQRFSDDDIVNHMIFALMAAHDTSTITLSMMTYLIGKHPEWQDRLRAESRALDKPFLDYDDLDRLPSMDLVFKEATRMYAPAGALPRQALVDTEILGHYIPAGTNLMVNAFASMRLHKWWPDPDRFDPERFAPHRREDKIHRFAWSPFGGGEHKCIGLYFGGMTVKSILHQLLLGYRWHVPRDYEPPLAWGTGPLPSDGLPMRLCRL